MLLIAIALHAALLGAVVSWLVTRHVYVKMFDQVIREEIPKPPARQVDRSIATQCDGCDLWWAPWIFGPALGEPCHKCGQAVVPYRSRTSPDPSSAERRTGTDRER